MQDPATHSRKSLYLHFGLHIIIIIIIIMIGTTAHFEPRPSSEASASHPHSLHHSSSFSPPTSWHHPSRHPPRTIHHAVLLAPSITPSSHLSFGLPLCIFPSTVTRTLLAALCSSSRMTCPAYLRQLTMIHVTMSLSLYNVYSWLLYLILHSPFSFVDPKMALKIFLSKTPKMALSDFDSTQISEPYGSNGLING